MLVDRVLRIALILATSLGVLTLGTPPDEQARRSLLPPTSFRNPTLTSASAVGPSRPTGAQTQISLAEGLVLLQERYLQILLADPGNARMMRRLAAVRRHVAGDC